MSSQVSASTQRLSLQLQPERVAEFSTDLHSYGLGRRKSAFFRRPAVSDYAVAVTA